MNHGTRSFRVLGPKALELRATIEGHRASVLNCCWVGAGLGLIATCGADKTLCFWDPSSSYSIRARLPTREIQHCLAWGEDRPTQLYTGSLTGTLTRWDLPTMSAVEVHKGAHTGPVNQLLLLSELGQLVSAGGDGLVHLWELLVIPEHGDVLRLKKTLRGHGREVYSLAYSPSYHCLLSAGLDTECLVWNPYVEHVPIFRLKGHTCPLVGVVVVEGGPQVITADVGGVFRTWDMRNFRCMQTFGAGSASTLSDLTTYCYLPSQRRLVAGTSSGRITLYDASGDRGQVSDVTDTRELGDVLYDHCSGKVLLAVGADLKVWCSDGPLAELKGVVSLGSITCMCMSADGSRLFLGTSTGQVGLHSLIRAGARVLALPPHPRDVSQLLTYTREDDEAIRLVSACWEGVVRVCEISKAGAVTVKAEFRVLLDGVSCLALRGGLLAAGSVSGQVAIFNLSTLKHEDTLRRVFP
jgi:WD40 repeat protein